MGIDSRVLVLTYVPSLWLMIPTAIASSNDICSFVRGSRTPSITNQSIDRSINRSINQSINQSIDQLIDRLIDQSINQSIDQSINQSIDQSITNQSVNQSINQSIVATVSEPAMYCSIGQFNPSSNPLAMTFVRRQTRPCLQNFARLLASTFYYPRSGVVCVFCLPYMCVFVCLYVCNITFEISDLFGL